MECVSISVTLKHLLLSVNVYAVVVYNIGNFSQPIGVLAFGPFMWSVAHNSAGNVVAMGSDGQGHQVSHIYKLSRI